MPIGEALAQLTCQQESCVFKRTEPMAETQEPQTTGEHDVGRREAGEEEDDGQKGGRVNII